MRYEIFAHLVDELTGKLIAGQEPPNRTEPILQVACNLGLLFSSRRIARAICGACISPGRLLGLTTVIHGVDAVKWTDMYVGLSPRLTCDVIITGRGVTGTGLFCGASDGAIVDSINRFRSASERCKGQQRIG